VVVTAMGTRPISVEFKIVLRNPSCEGLGINHRLEELNDRVVAEGVRSQAFCTKKTPNETDPPTRTPSAAKCPKVARASAQRPNRQVS